MPFVRACTPSSPKGGTWLAAALGMAIILTLPHAGLRAATTQATAGSAPAPVGPGATSQPTPDAPAPADTSSPFKTPSNQPAAGPGASPGPSGKGAPASAPADAAAAAPAPVAPIGPPPALKRGVNLTDWFIGSQRQALTSRDFDQLKQVGFDHVRIPINPEAMGFSLSEAAEGRVLFDFEGLDDAVNLARGARLTVILDIHPTDGFMTMAEQDPRAGVSFVSLWKAIAEHYKTYTAQDVVFEIVNEPHYTKDVARYQAMVTDVVAGIRQVTAAHVIVIDTPRGASLDSFDGVPTPPDDRVYVAFHFYEPYLFTHQGLRLPSSRGMSLRYFRMLPYPSSAVRPKVNYAPGVADVLDARKALLDYVSSGWSAAKLAARVKIAADWAASHHAHVLCTEFGAVRSTTDPVARYQWIADARAAFEGAGIGWTVWDYADRFGITVLNGLTVVEPSDGFVHLADPTQGSRDVEPEAIKALFGG